MVKVGFLLLGLCGVASFATPVSSFQESGGQHSPTTPVASQLRKCDDNAPINCHAVDGVTAPKVLYAPDPKFTPLARKKKLSGKSIVGIIVGRDGKPYHVHLVRSMSEGLDHSFQPAALELDQKAIEAVERYKFQPATYQGKPVPVEVNVEVNFLVY